MKKRVVILGKEKEVQELKCKIKENPYFGYELIEIEREKDLLSEITSKDIQLIVVSQDFEKTIQWEKFLTNPCLNDVFFRDFLTFFEEIVEKTPLSQISFSLFNLKKEEKNIYDKLKRALDFFLSSCILLFTFPLWILIALAIKIEDSGPIFYFQERIGEKEKKFKVIKFRTMIPEAEKIGPKWTEENDTRITWVGKILRKTHLDELPQIINILKGEMSFVGPRPQRVEFVEELKRLFPLYTLRHCIKPGLTGWAQIKFKSPTSLQEFIEQLSYDIYYIKNRSFFFDLRILLKTFQVLF